jgi:dihydrofolate reductase
MSRVFADIGISLDGYCAGPNAGPRNPLGDDGALIHRWGMGLRAWRERIKLAGGTTGRDNEIVAARFARAGAYVMGRRLFDEGEVGWLDPPPFRGPVFVVTHRPRARWVRGGGTTFTFVDGIERALDLAAAAAAGRDVDLVGGADVVAQTLALGRLDELNLHVAPVRLGRGTRLLDFDLRDLPLPLASAERTAAVSHLSYAAA